VRVSRKAYPYPIRTLFLYYANPVLATNYGAKFIEVLKDTPEESYTELFAGIAEAYPYPIRTLFLYYANPVQKATEPPATRRPSRREKKTP
jgi:anaerobic selenocysteine-containing dehydrogenase